MSAAPTDHRRLGVLLVEDDPGDVLIAREALQAAKLDTRLDVVSDGVLAMEFLRKQGQYADRERPDLILLDLNLPRMSGLEVLAEVKADPELRRIPIVVLTTSTSADDVIKSYDLHANVYVAKPVDFNAFAQVVKKIDEFFGNVAKLPPD
ncbi:MAG TPA: response regulator [Jatrophihabitantaceae bacterium]|jgi:two-component system response regulator|nr:response regulator [Jatrophihabitantaceae bacterium]